MTMRKFLLPLAALAALMPLSCRQPVEIPVVPDSAGGDDPAVVDPDPVFGGDVVFSATIAALPDGTQPVWKEGEAIVLSDGTSVQTLVNAGPEGVLASFPARIREQAGHVVAVSPAMDGLSPSLDGLMLTVPAVQSAAAPAPACRVAVSGDKQLYFKDVFATVLLSVTFEGVTKLVLHAADAAAGCAVSFDGESFSATPSGSCPDFTLEGPLEKDRKYALRLAPGRMAQYTVSAYIGDEKVSESDGKNLELAPGGVAEVAGVEPSATVYRITNLWVWGGTGPEFGCTKVYDLLNNADKAACFDPSDGRGVHALKDNYFELAPDGTFRNWAGADGRNWWFVFSAGGRTLDLKAFYDVIPRAEGTYTLAGDAMTFRKPDGTTSSGRLLPPATYPLAGTTPALSVTTTHPGLMFTITGGKDYWSGPASDYDVFACHPRAMLFELEEMPVGFHVPSESRTVDADFEYIEPVPVGFDFDTLPGTWTVYGGNSAPYGLFVLGGSGNDPAFLSPIDKSWNWNDNIWYECDNDLTFTVGAKTAAEMTGTTEWTGGDNGKFWDYIWKKTGEDLSRFYDKIPKGVSNYSLNLSTLTITLGNGEQAKFLSPGSHEFAYGKIVTVPDGCFALAFHLGEPIAATAERWTDVDRFINAPLEYVMIFERK